MEEETTTEKTIAIPQSQFDLIENRWTEFVDYCSRQNELDFQIEKQQKQRKIGMGFLELFLLIGVICISLLSILSFIITLYFAYIGIQIGSLPLILAVVTFILLAINIFQFIRIMQSGQWFKFGLDLRKWKSGWIKFTKGRGIMLTAAPYSQKSEFREGKDNTVFLTKGKGYHDPSTGGTLFTVREGAINDFDVHEEYKGKIEDMGKTVKEIAQESWFAGAVWNKIDLPMLKILIIIAIVTAALGVLLSVGNLAVSYQNAEKLNNSITAMDGNIMIKINEIQSKIASYVPAQGVITGG